MACFSEDICGFCWKIFIDLELHSQEEEGKGTIRSRAKSAAYFRDALMPSFVSDG